MLECEQILTEGTLDLMRNAEVLKAIRNGEWTQEKIEQFFNDKERQLEEVYNKSELPYGPDMPKIKALLVDCLEMHYGPLTEYDKPDKYRDAVNDIRKVLEKL